MADMSGSHFSRDLFGFLTELKANNNRDWFNANKARYVAEVEAHAAVHHRLCRASGNDQREL